MRFDAPLLMETFQGKRIQPVLLILSSILVEMRLRDIEEDMNRKILFSPLEENTNDNAK